MLFANPPIERIKNSAASKQILGKIGPFIGHVNCCYLLGVDQEAGLLYYRDLDNNWQLIGVGSGDDGGGGGGNPNPTTETLQEVIDNGNELTKNNQILAKNFVFDIFSGADDYSGPVSQLHLENTEAFLYAQSNDEAIYSELSVNGLQGVILQSGDGDNQTVLAITPVSANIARGLEEAKEIVTSVNDILADEFGNVDLGTLSGGTQNLQEVTDEGNTTNNRIIVSNITITDIPEYANDEAAMADGLGEGDVYRLPFLEPNGFYPLAIVGSGIGGGGGTGGGSSILLQTNTVDNDSQSTLNLVDSDTISVEDLGDGEITFHASGGGSIGGTGISNYVARWSDTNTLGTGIIQDDTAKVIIAGFTTLNGTIPQTSNTGRSLYINPTLLSGANNDTQIALDIAATFQNNNSGLNTAQVSVGGTLYTPGTYTGVPLSGTGGGTGALGTVIISGSGSITSIVVTTRGTGYIIGNTITINPSDIGGTGSGAVIYQASTGYTGLNQVGIRQTAGNNYLNTTAGWGTIIGNYSTTSPANNGFGLTRPLTTRGGGGIKVELTGPNDGVAVGNLGTVFSAGNTIGINANGAVFGFSSSSVSSSRVIVGHYGTTGGTDIWSSYQQSIPAIRANNNNNVLINSTTDNGFRLDVAGTQLITNNPAINQQINTITHVLRIDSTTQGLLPPRVTMAQRDGFSRVSYAVVTNNGTSYASVPSVAITGGGGTGATGTAVLAYKILTVSISGGSGYSGTVPVFFSNSYTNAQGTANLSGGSVVSINLPTDLYNINNPTIVIGGNGTGATATVASYDTVVGRIDITGGGINITSTPTISITGGGGSGAAATAIISTLVAGTMVYCTDETAADASIGVMQAWNGSVWKKMW